MKVASETWIKIGAEMNRSIKATPVAQKWANRLNLSIKTIFKNAKRFGGYDSGKSQKTLSVSAKQRTDEIKRHVFRIAAIYHDKASDVGKESNMPLEKAIQIYQRNQPQKIELPSTSTIARYLRNLSISRKHLKRVTPKRIMRSLYPNHVWQYDTSVCRYYIANDRKVTRITKQVDYKNKPFKKKFRLVRHVIVDHYSGAFYLYYSFQQTIVDYAEFCFEAFQQKPGGYIFHGIPEMLIIDHDKGLRSNALMRLFSYLNIDVPEGSPYTPWSKGTVEQAMNIIERRFESGLIYKPGLDGSPEEQLKKINDWAIEWAIEFQKTFEHSRYKCTRFAKWDQDIVTVPKPPNRDTFFKLLYFNPISRTVESNGYISYQNIPYRIGHELVGEKVDIYIHPHLFQDNKAITFLHPSTTENPDNFVNFPITKKTVLPDYKGADGLPNDGVTVWGEYSEVGKTQTEINMELVKNADIDLETINPHIPDEEVGQIEFMPKPGEEITVESMFSYSSLEYDFLNLKLELTGRLGRHFLPEEKAYLTQLNKKQETFTENDIEEILKEFKRIRMQTMTGGKKS